MIRGSHAVKELAGKVWRHPEHRDIAVPCRAAVAIAVIGMGVSDYAVIATATGLTIEEVKRIDMAKDPSVRQLGAVGIPSGQYFKLETTIRCPKCHAKVNLAPCVACESL